MTKVVRSEWKGLIPLDMESRFLDVLRATGSVITACTQLQLARSSLYSRRAKDRAFRKEWDEALSGYQESFQDRAIRTLEALGLGQWKELRTEEGTLILNDSFDPIYEFNIDNVDPRVLNKLVDRLWPTGSGVNINIGRPHDLEYEIEATKPRLVIPNPDEAVDAEFEVITDESDHHRFLAHSQPKENLALEADDVSNQAD